MEKTYPQREIHRIRHELRMRKLTVSAIQRLSPGFVSVTFSGTALSDFISKSFDDHIKFMFELEGVQIRRDYTPRLFDANTHSLTIEFALHESGKASDWARNAHIGQHAVVGGPRGSMIMPVDYPWQLLIGDASALPAIRRRLEELPETVNVKVMALIESDADRLLPATAANLEVQWFAQADDLVETIRDQDLPEGEGLIWGAGESGMMQMVRRILVQDKQHPKEALRIAGYWKRGVADFHERFED